MILSWAISNCGLILVKSILDCMLGTSDNKAATRTPKNRLKQPLANKYCLPGTRVCKACWPTREGSCWIQTRLFPERSQTSQLPNLDISRSCSQNSEYIPFRRWLEGSNNGVTENTIFEWASWRLPTDQVLNGEAAGFGHMGRVLPIKSLSLPTTKPCSPYTTQYSENALVVTDLPSHSLSPNGSNKLGIC
jgi:hypothetical protein